jgi:hypothetical protein
MSCEAWKWLAFVGSGLTIVTAPGSWLPLSWWPAGNVRAVTAWGTLGVISLVSLIVYVAHCTG